MKNVLRTIACIIVVMIGFLIWLVSPLRSSYVPENAMGVEHLIAHAGGHYKGRTYTNSKGAVLTALSNGYRYIELDLYQLPTGQVVCAHDSLLYDPDSVFTLNEAIDIWTNYPFCFVTDKISDPLILNQYFKSNRAHVYVETFNAAEYCQLKRNGYVPMLSVGDGIRGLLKYVVASFYSGKVDRIVAHCQTPEYMLRIYKRLGAKIAVYTVNDISYLKNHIGKDVDMIYTDYIIPSCD